VRISIRLVDNFGELGMRTMLPASLLPRAKMKMVFGQAELLPASSSVRVALAWRASSLRVIGSVAGSATGAGIATGEAMAMEAIRERMATDFILTIVVVAKDCE